MKDFSLALILALANYDNASQANQADTTKDEDYYLEGLGEVKQILKWASLAA